MPISKIIESKHKRELSSQFGTSHVFAIVLEDGVKGDMTLKADAYDPKIKAQELISTEIEYEYTANENPNWPGIIKQIKKKPVNFRAFNQKNENSENARIALMVAKDLVIAGKVPDGTKTSDLAEQLWNWLQKHS